MRDPLASAVAESELVTSKPPVEVQTESAQTLATQTGESSQTQSDEAQAADEEQIKIVRGRVVNEAGDPVAGAKLWLPLKNKPRRTAETTTDDAGNFEIKCPADWISPLSGIIDLVWAYAPGYSIQAQRVHEAIRGTGEKEYTIKLPPENNSRLKVLAPDGEALGGVLVQPQNYYVPSVGNDLVPEEMWSDVSGRTDENGVVILPGIDPGPLFMIKITSEKFGQQTFRVDPNQDDLEREIKLRPTGTIKGKLLCENSEWVGGVRLVFTTDSQDHDSRGSAEVVTDSEGQFEVPVLASGGPVRAYVNLDSERPVRPLLKDDLYLTAGETLHLDIPLVDAPLVHGRVVAKSTGKPIENAKIALYYGKHWQSATVTTDKQGQYSGRALPGRVRVHIFGMPNGYVQLGAVADNSFKVPDEIDEFELPTIEVVDSHEISGQLIDKEDQPIPNVRVNALFEGRFYGSGKSDVEGIFKMTVPVGIETEFTLDSDSESEIVVDHPTWAVPVSVVSKDPLIIRCSFDINKKKPGLEPVLKPGER